MTDRMETLKKNGAQEAARLSGGWLLAARLAWVALIAMMFVVVAYGYPEYYRKLISLNFEISPLTLEWSPQTLAPALSSLGLTPGFLAAFAVFWDALQVLAFFIPGALIFWRKSDTWLGLFASYVLVGMGFTIGGGSETLTRLASPWQQLVFFASALVWPAFFIFLFLFPDGRFVPRWTRLFLPLWALFFLWWGLIDLVLDLGLETFQSIGIPFTSLSIAAALFSQVYRYLRVSGPVERQQTKWFLLAVALTLVVVSLQNFLFVPFLQTTGLPVRQVLLMDLAWQPVDWLAQAALPIAILIALFRYRLWDIDVIIRKTLVYTAVTGLLALVYFGGVLLLQSLFGRFGGEQSPAALVLSTLAIAALFNPLRRRVQEGVDRRFYRKKYDAERVLADFASKARDEVDIETLSVALVGAVEETVQPIEASLWLRPAKEK